MPAGEGPAPLGVSGELPLLERALRWCCSPRSKGGAGSSSACPAPGSWRGGNLIPVFKKGDGDAYSSRVIWTGGLRYRGEGKRTPKRRKTSLGEVEGGSWFPQGLRSRWERAGDGALALSALGAWKLFPNERLDFHSQGHLFGLPSWRECPLVHPLIFH